MAEPQPPNVQEGADAPDVVPANAEDRKAAAAMSSLDARPEEDGAPKKELDIKALNDAMKNLGVAQDQSKSAAAAGTKKEETPKKLVKVDPADVTLLVRRRLPILFPIDVSVLTRSLIGRTAGCVEDEGD